MLRRDKMANTKKDLIKTAEDLLEDIFDNYDSYSTQDKQKVQNLMNQMANLNIALDYYDKQKKAEKSKNLWEKFKEAVGKFFG